MEKIFRNIAIIGLFILPFLPLLVTDWLFFPFVAGKGFAFRIITEIVFVSSVAAVFLNRRLRPKLSALAVSVLFFAAVTLLADAFGVYPYKSFWSNYERMEGFVMIFHLLLYFFSLAAVFQTAEIWKKYFQTWLFGSFLVSVYALFQIFGIFEIHQGTTRLDATLGNATYLAIYLLFNIFIALYFLLKDWDDSKLGKWLYPFLIVLESFILYRTATRGAMLGLIGGLLVASLYAAFFERRKILARKSGIFLLSAIVIFSVGFFAIKNTAFVRGNPVLGRFASISLSETTTKSRFIVWNMSFQGFKERPLLGFGQENFNYVFNKYYDPGLYGQEEWFDRAHNIIFDWLVAGGVLGLLSYLSLFGAAVFLLLRSAIQPFEKALFLGLLGGYFFQNLFVFDNVVSYVLFFTVLAFIHFVSKKDELAKEAISASSGMAANGNIPPFVPLLLPLALVFSLYFVNAKPMVAGNLLIQALGASDVNAMIPTFKEAIAYDSFGTAEVREHVSQTADRVRKSNKVPDATKVLFLNYAKEELDKEIMLKPEDARYYAFAGMLLSNFDRPDLAVPYFEKAHALSPKKQTILFGLGESYLESGQKEKALESFKEAYELEPNYKQAVVIYALGLIYNNRSNEAEKLLVADGKPILDQRIATAYFRSGDVRKGIKVMLKVAEAFPDDHDNFAVLAAMYAETGQNQKAIAALEKAIELNPGYREQGEYYIRQLKSGL